MKYLLSLLFLVFLSGNAIAQERYASYVLNATTEEMMQEEFGEEQRIPASLTKIMTLYIIFEELQSERITLNSRLNVSRNASRQPPTRLGLRRNTTITVEQAIQALIVQSANDVAVVVAENLSRSESRFVSRMNDTARNIGLTNTTFGNASGLPHPRNLTTARDMAYLSLAIWRDFPEYYHYFSTPSFSYGRSYGRNHNRLLGTVEGVDGLKTGYTHASGFNLATMVERNNIRIIVIVMGGSSSEERNNQVITLIEEAYSEVERRSNINILQSRDNYISYYNRNFENVNDYFSGSESFSRASPTALPTVEITP